MDPIIFDRFTMAFSLAIHIVLAVMGVALPAVILAAEYLGVKYNDKEYSVLAKRLTVALLILFAVGTASGMLVAVNLFFLWPNFAALVSKVAILPIYAEVFAFFSESIFLALYIYSAGFFKNKYYHMAMMAIAAIGAAASAALITILNAFMNTPVGFDIQTFLKTGVVANIHPLAVFTSPSSGIEVAHVIATSYFAGAGIFLGYFAYRLLKAKGAKEKAYYEKALKLVFGIAIISTFFAILTGILSIQSLYSIQPEKFAAIEMDMNPISHAPEIIGGIYSNNAIRDAIFIPNLQSILSGGSPNITVPGLSQYPSSTWPPLFIHDLFDLMFFAGVAIGVFLLAVLLLYAKIRSIFTNKLVLKLLIVTAFLSVILLENGWMVDEIGRQPWIIYNVMTVQQAANTSPAIIPLAAMIVALYAILLPFTILVLRKIFAKRDLTTELKA